MKKTVLKLFLGGMVAALHFGLLGLPGLSAAAEIFKCTSTAGKVYYNDQPCPVTDDEKKMQAVKDPLNGYIPPGPDSSAGVDSRRALLHGQAPVMVGQNREPGAPEGAENQPPKGPPPSRSTDSEGGAPLPGMTEAQSRSSDPINVNLEAVDNSAQHGDEAAGLNTNATSPRKLTTQEKRSLINVKRDFE